MNSETPFEEKSVCSVCGKYGAYRFGDELLCMECYEARASCCPEFGSFDLWADKPANAAETRKPDDGR